LSSSPSQVLDLASAMDVAIEAARARGGTKPLSIVTEYPAHLPAVQGDRAAVADAIGAMIRTVSAFTDRGEVRVRAELLSLGDVPVTFAEVAGHPEGVTQGGPWAMISVQSSEGRIPPDTMQALCAGKTLRAAAAESVSLAPVLSAAQACGGHPWVDSQPSGGARISLALPLRAGGGRADWSSLRQRVEAHLPDSSTPAKSLLLLVEEPARRAPLVEELTTAGYRVVPVASGAEVQPLAHEQVPDLILLDLQAREPSAFEIAMVLKQDSRTSVVPVLFLSSVEDPLQGVTWGAVDFVVRSAGTGALLSTIQAILTSGLHPSSRVLVAEPNDAARDPIIGLIQSHGYRVTEARSAEEALVLAERVSPALILVNVRLAGERDYWLLRNLRRLLPQTEIIVLADALTDAEGRAAVRRGASGFSKTGKLSDVLAEVRRRGA
jgi:DNA-binding response OmpR family regulator